ncbi:MAG: sel1 repeat family protein, partial [Deltaproteobacteria bacterium]|nr:sel1 repeat family protein [Deltaproteobacteria bacterium]
EVKAVEWLRKAADQKEKFAQYHLGLVYATGRGVPKNPDEALKWFRLASANGCPVPKDFLTKEGISRLGEAKVTEP